MEAKRVQLPLDGKAIQALRAGDVVVLSGRLYTARDAAHAKLVALLESGEPLPIPAGAAIYYTGPCPAAPGEVIGPCGPTTSKRMDAFTPALLDYGVTALIGKGPLGPLALAAIQGRAIYFAATGGAGMLLAESVKACRPIAFPELGTEAVYELDVEDFPAIVATDAAGRSLFAQEQA